MTPREQHLLALAWEAAGGNLRLIRDVDEESHDFYIASALDRVEGATSRIQPTLAAALEALLDALGVAVPPEPPLRAGAGGVRCRECGAYAAADGKGTPIVLRHARDCPEHPDNLPSIHETEEPS